jgi:uncharacterized cupin superfamily protein
MPKIDPSKIPVRTGSIYPPEFQHVCEGRLKQPLGDAVGLTQFGVNFTRIKPGAASSLRHWHTHEDEFIYMIEGELVLIEDDGETVLKPGDCAGFKADVHNGHTLVNRSQQDAVYLEVGTRAKSEYVEYPDADLALQRDENGPRFFRLNGKPYKA